MTDTQRPLRVTMVNKYYYPPHLGGVETHLRDISEGLVEHAGAAVRAIVCNESGQRAEESVGGVDVVRLPRQFALSSAPVALSMPGELAAEMRRAEPPDVMHFHFPYPWGELSALRANPDVPRVVTYHSDIVRQKRMLAALPPVHGALLGRGRPDHRLIAQHGGALRVPGAARREVPRRQLRAARRAHLRSHRGALAGPAAPRPAPRSARSCCSSGV